MSNSSTQLPIQARALSQVPTSLSLRQTLRTLQKLCQVQVKQAFGDIQKLAQLTVKQAKQEMKNLEKPAQEQVKQGIKLIEKSSSIRLKQAVNNLQNLSSIKVRQAAKGVLQNVQASQMKQALKNLQRIPSSNLSSNEFKQQMRLYAEKNLVIYKQQKQSPSMFGDSISSCYVREQRQEGKQSEWYINQLTGEIVKLQPLNGVIVQKKPIDQSVKLPQHLHQLLALLHKKLLAYMDKHYAQQQQQAATTCTHRLLSIQQVISRSINNNITIGFTSKINNTQNYYTSEIISYWQFCSKTYSADLTLANHFFENGNIIMKRQLPIKNKQYPINQQVDLANLNEEKIDKIISIIAKEEKHCQKELQKLYANKSTEALKKLRRQNPFTQTKMVWNLNAVRMNEEINTELPKMII